jgi:hypothetical protein
MASGSKRPSKANLKAKQGKPTNISAQEVKLVSTSFLIVFNQI